MKARIWLNNAHASQRDVAALMLRSMGERLEVVTSHKSYREDIFMSASDSFIEPSFPEDEAGGAYVEWALAQARQRGVRGMIAMRHRLSLVGAQKAFAEAGIRVAAGASSVRAIDLCEHKDQFTAEVAAAGIPVPKTIAARTADELCAAIAEIELDGEACVKPVLGVYGRGYWRFQRDKQLFDVFSGTSAHEIDPEIYIAAFAAAADPKPVIVMEHLPGAEYSIDCVCDNGKLVAHAKRRKSSTYQTISTGGIEVEIAEALVEKLGLDGLVNVQTRVDREGVTKVLEVNTRPSGGIGYSAAAGINLPANAAQMLLGEAVTFRTLSEPVAVRVSDEAMALPHTSQRLNEVAA